MERGARKARVMSISDMMAQARDTITVKRVFGDPYDKEGVTVIPAALIIGGLGGGEGTAATKEERPRGGRGIGIGLIGWPVGAYVIKDGEVMWRPAVNVNLVILGGQLVGVVAIMAARSVLRAWLARQP
jgi:uncharacterized spore protein YtfJ